MITRLTITTPEPEVDELYLLSAFQGFSDIFIWMGTMVGIICIIAALVMLLKKFMTPDPLGPSWGMIIMLMIMAPAFLFGVPFLFSTDENAEPVAEATPSPEPTATSEPKPTSDPISLPEIENPAVLWTWLGIAVVVLALLFSIYVFVQRVHRDRVKKLELEQKARELAEAEARRQREAAERQARIEARWATITDLHAELKRRIVDAETDWDTLFTLPALSDVSYRQTRALHRAMREAENAVIPMPEGFDERTPMEKIPYVKKVHAFEDAWKIALSHAQKLGTSKLPDEELRTIKRIRQLLVLAEGSGASEFERATAYEQIQKLLGELRVVQLPNRVRAAIESHRRLAITDGTEAEPLAVSNVPSPMRAR